MTTPNEPGSSAPGDDAGDGDTPADSGGPRSNPRSGSGRVTHTGETPPWQRGGPPPGQTPQRPPDSPDGRSAGHSAGVEARLNRFVSGTAAPGAQKSQGQGQAQAGQAQPGQAPAGQAQAGQAKASLPESEAARSEGQRAEGYDSELPDLSASARRPAPRKSAPERGRDTAESPGTNRAAEQRAQATVRPRGPVRASMQLRRIDPWSALKVSLILSVALFFVWMIAVALLYLVLGSMGVWSKLNTNVGDLLTDASGGGELVSAGSIFGGATLIGLVNIVVLTALGTVGALVYNVTTDLIGGVEVTLADRE